MPGALCPPSRAGGSLPWFPLPACAVDSITSSPQCSALMAWGPQLSNVPSKISFLPACFEITTSQGYCTRGPRRQVKREEEGAGLPALKLRRNTRMTGCSGVERCVCWGVRCRPWLQGWVRGPLGPPPLGWALDTSYWNFHVFGAPASATPTPNHETKRFSFGSHL